MAFKIEIPVIEIGVSFSHAVTWSLKDELGNVTPVDLFTWSGRMQFKKKITDAEPYLDLGTGNGGLTFIGNLIQMEAGASDTKVLAPVEDGVFDLILWPTADLEAAVRLAYGSFSAVRITSEVPFP